jgi:hypothetical protein
MISQSIKKLKQKKKLSLWEKKVSFAAILNLAAILIFRFFLYFFPKLSKSLQSHEMTLALLLYPLLDLMTRVWSSHRTIRRSPDYDSVEFDVLDHLWSLDHLVPIWFGWIWCIGSLFYLLSTWSTWFRFHTCWEFSSEFSKNRKFSNFSQITKQKKPKNITLSLFFTFIYFLFLLDSQQVWIRNQVDHVESKWKSDPIHQMYPNHMGFQSKWFWWDNKRNFFVVPSDQPKIKQNISKLSTTFYY